MNSTSKAQIKRLAAMAAFATVAAVPGVAQGDSSLPPCPTGVPLQGTVNSACEAAQGVENSVQNGGTRQAVEELAQRQQTTVNDLRTQQEQAVNDKLTATRQNTDAVRQTAESGVQATEQGAGQVPQHVDDGERSIEQSFVPSEDSREFTCPVPKTDRPLADHLGDQACSVAASAANVINVPTQEQLMAEIQNLIGLGGFGDTVENATMTIMGAVSTLVMTEPGSIGSLVDAILGNTDNAGSQTVTNVYEAAQCVRKGDYGDGARETPCPR